MIVFTCIILFSVQFGIKANTLANQYASQVYPFQIIISSSFFRVGHSTGRWSPTPAHKIFLHGGRYRHDKRILGCSWRHYCSTWRRTMASVLPSVRYESKSMESSVWREHRSSQPNRHCSSLLWRPRREIYVRSGRGSEQKISGIYTASSLCEPYGMVIHPDYNKPM